MTRANHQECVAEQVAELCRQAGFELTAVQAEGMAEFLRLLMQWNRAMNLVGTRSWRETLETLAMDSLWLARFLERDVWPGVGETGPDAEHGEIWDLGAGAGLPGIPLRLVWPQGDYYMVEAREKRALFLSTVLARLRLPRTSVFRGRAEQFMPGRQASVILSRAFMPWLEVLRLAEPCLSPGGRVVLLLNESVPVPSGWADAGHMEYRTAGGTRHFCAFTPINAPS